MASRWFVFWIACWIISSVRDEVGGFVFLLFAVITTDPAQSLFDKIKSLVSKNENS